MTSKISVSILLVMYCLSASAEAIKIDCPKSIDVTESALEVNRFWTVEIDSGKRGRFLDSVSVYSGRPENMGNLIPDKTIEKGSRRIYIWKFADQADEIWIGCTYINSMLQLTQPLPKGVHKCELTEKILPSGVKLAIETMNCE